MSVSEKVKRPSNNAIQRKAEDTPGRSMMPPEMSLSASPAQMKGDDPKISKKDQKTMEYGEASTGPVSVQGLGDAHEFDATDVNQGALGDCYLLAALMTLANTNPGLLDNAIDKKDDGTYDVTLYKRKGFLGGGDLEQQTVNVTSSFVVHSGTSSPAYAKGGDLDVEDTFEREIWVQLIEKAYAKMNGSYKKIDGGFTEVALEALTGESFSSTSLGNGFLGIGKTSDADMKTNIKKAVDDKEPVTASTKSQKAIDKADKKAGVEFAKDNDIVGRHAYSVMEADDSKIKVRNPWGSGAKTAEPIMDWQQFRSYYGRFTTKKA
jgi:hypothetical protein